MTEQGTRIFLGLAAAIAFVFYIMAIVFGLQNNLDFSARALTYLAVAVVATVVAVILYRRYTHLRQIRWQNEMKAGEDKMRQLLTEETETTEPTVDGKL